jgi:serine/threonine-protein phosphatase 4 regulatory subunit 1
MVLEQLV